MGRYNDRIKALNGGKRSKRQFILLYRNVKRSKAYHALTVYARALLIELVDRYNGCNNGMIGLGVREAKYELGCSQGRASKAMLELDDAGLARPTKIGAWRGRRATEWRLMFLRCDKTQDPAVTQWEQRKPHSEFTQGYAEVHPVTFREPLSSRGGTQKPNSSMNDPGLSSRGDTHIDIYQGEGEAAELTEEGKRLADSLFKTESNQRAQNNVALSANPKTHIRRRKP
jgi:hypothetical protein